MKQEWQIYIKGNSSRGDEVINILKQHGGKPIKPDAISGTIGAAIYYIDHDGIITFSTVDKETTKIIMDNYKEIKLPGLWSDGDILVRKDNNNLFCVYQKPTDNGKGFLCHVYVTKDVLFTGVTVPTDPTDNYRKATDTEKSTFYSLINNHNLSWEAEKKQLIDKEELPKQWEDGDILIRKDRIEYTVFRKYSCTTMFYNYDFLISTDEDNHIWSSLAGEERLYKTENFRLATSKEIKQFYDFLHRMNEDWDSEKKHLVKLKQKPILGIFIE